MDDVLGALRSTPVPLAEAATGVPGEPGLYAVWAPFGAVPGISGPRHPVERLQLLYVGIAPNGPASGATLRSRVVGDHIRGTTGSSTLRRSLAALLSEREGWRSRWTTRPVLINRDELALSEWMAEKLRLTWAEHSEPWTVESRRSRCWSRRSTSLTTRPTRCTGSSARLGSAGGAEHGTAREASGGRPMGVGQLHDPVERRPAARPLDGTSTRLGERERRKTVRHCYRSATKSSIPV